MLRNDPLLRATTFAREAVYGRYPARREPNGRRVGFRSASGREGLYTAEFRCKPKNDGRESMRRLKRQMTEIGE